MKTKEALGIVLKERHGRFFPLEHAKKLYLSGRSLSQIEPEVRYTTDTIRKHLKRCGVVLRSRGGAVDGREFPVKQAAALYAQGLNPRQIGEKIGYTGKTVRIQLVLLGVWKGRRP